MEGVGGHFHSRLQRESSYSSPSVVCHLEGSGQWPQDAEAVRRVRAAFQLRLAELLTQQHGLRCRATATHTDVFKVILVQGRESPGKRLWGCQEETLWAPGCRQQGNSGPRLTFTSHPILCSNRMGLCSGSAWPISGSHRS